jgi:hypothetical protein
MTHQADVIAVLKPQKQIGIICLRLSRSRQAAYHQRE